MPRKRSQLSQQSATANSCDFCVAMRHMIKIGIGWLLNEQSMNETALEKQGLNEHKVWLHQILELRRINNGNQVLNGLNVWLHRILEL
ncbi:hypothetical protein EVAR_84591_1 [Eumeta japonica]|uniref:Uncharacterized protein n=1 Tax=Eumeta variegata TaxID=151549 RepID=A0A4C1ZGX0_EUMVA|nr:hypothetical protein EVAR_84591_1 [Eumeta japonica]